MQKNTILFDNFLIMVYILYYRCLNRVGPFLAHYLVYPIGGQQKDVAHPTENLYFSLPYRWATKRRCPPY